MRQINEAALDLIKSFEKCVLQVYADQGGKPTCGFGHLVIDDDDLDMGDWITMAEADQFLEDDLEDACNAVMAAITCPLSDNQYGSACSLVYNTGEAPLKGTFGNLLNSGDYENAAKEILKWCHVNVNGQEIISKGLVSRRQAEYNLFNT
jgi:lysozyme